MKVSKSMLRKFFNNNRKNSGRMNLLRCSPYIFLFVLIAIFFHPILFGKIPLPLDALVGAYYPWLDFKWGYLVGVPFKNIALSDVFSQLYPWRILSMEAFRNGQWPLWNPYSFSGTPLLANWQSAPFYPLNILMLVFGNIWGWTFLIILQPVLSALFMYLYLKKIGIKVLGRLTGSVIFTFSGFMTTYMQYATIGQIVLWLPLQLLFIEKYIETKKVVFLCLYSLTFFPVLTGGFFQPALYVIGVSFSYALIRIIQTYRKNISSILLLIAFTALGVLTAAVQLIPTLELFKYSIRALDHNIVEYQYGLLPLRNLITLLSPDFFGNPATNNFWGFMQYQETSGYFSILALVLIIPVILRSLKNFYNSYFTLLFLLSITFAFANPVSRMVYQMNIPGISSGYASRLLILTGFSASILAALGSEAFIYKKTLKTNAFLLLFTATIFFTLIYDLNNQGQGKYSLISSFFNIYRLEHLEIAMRNMIFPIGMLTICFISMLLLKCLGKYYKKIKSLDVLNKNSNIYIAVFLVVISLDLLRFAVKFTPFSPIIMANLSTSVIKYLKSNSGYFRIEREWGPLIPPNTWIFSRLYSPSGYDPLAIRSYAGWYGLCQRDIRPDTDIPNDTLTRYLEVDKYNSRCIDLFGVKYLVAIKRNAKDEYDQNGYYFNKNIPLEKYKEVYSDGKTAILENTTVLPRVSLHGNFIVEPDVSKAQKKILWDLDIRKDIVINKNPSFSVHGVDQNDLVYIAKYTPNEVLIEADTKKPVLLMLTDTFYPGWEVYINGKKSSILVADGIYKAVELPGGKSSVAFRYLPNSFKMGIITSILGFFTLLLLILYEKGHDKIRKRAS